MNTLVNIMGRIMMDGYDIDRDYPELDQYIDELENESNEKKYDELVALDAELENEYNPLFYAAVFLKLNVNPSHTWLARLIDIAESIEPNYANLRRTLFTKRVEDKTLLMFLIEVERDESESTGNVIRRDMIRYLKNQYHHLGLFTEIEEAQQFCVDQGIEIDLNTLGGRKTKKYKKSKSRKILRR